MGTAMSFMGKGIPSTQAISFLMGTLHKQFVERNITNFDEFHCAILDIFNTFNSALPGRHYDVPSPKEVEESYQKWKGAADAKKKEVFVALMKKSISINRLDDSAMIAGMLTPPAAMAAKRAAENVSQMKVIKAIPDVILVPAATVLALVSAKLTRRMLQGSRTNSGGAGGNVQDGPSGGGRQTSPQPAPPPVGVAMGRVGDGDATPVPRTRLLTLSPVPVPVSGECEISIPVPIPAGDRGSPSPPHTHPK